jgi:hypothetical protein
LVGTGADSNRNVALILVLCVVGIVMLGVFVAVGGYAVRVYKQRSRTVEAQRIAVELASGIARCGSRGPLPESTVPVPAALAFVDGSAYVSKPSDWSDPVFRCAGFSRSGAQYHQYQWVRLDPEQGVVTARADFDRDGVAESGVDVEVHCAGGACTASVPKPFGAGAEFARNAYSSSRDASSSTARSADKLPLPYLLIVFVCMLALLAGSIWTIVLAFLESVPWGIAVLIVPCASFVFTIKHWQKARVPFFLQLGSLAVIFVSGFFVGFFGYY